jgi:hypothetical protein
MARRCGFALKLSEKSQKNAFFYLRSFLPCTSTSIVICWMAILFNRNKRSLCCMPSFIKTAFMFSMLERQMRLSQLAV